MGTTIFAEMSALAVTAGAVNLGQGFPDTDGPREIAEAAAAAIMAGRGNQYPPGAGIPELRHAIAAHQRRFYDLDIDADSEVMRVWRLERRSDRDGHTWIRPADETKRRGFRQAVAWSGPRGKRVRRGHHHRSHAVCPVELDITPDAIKERRQLRIPVPMRLN